jgi:predicted flap endonuclease-1-like 5' DNA nuclease/uncharacterized membrane protein YeaQ/YmgE (transglycosylase-associated protein family)
MTTKEPVANCGLSSWVMAALVGVLALIIARMFSDISWTGAIFLGLIACVVAGLLFSYLFCRELPPLGAQQDTAEKPQPEAAPVKPASAETVAVAAAPEPETKPAPKAEAAEPVAAAPAGDADKPTMLSAAREGGPDNLKQIKGVGPKLEGLLHSMGIYHFDQVASWTAKEVAWVDENLQGFKGRVSRDEWVKQAKVLAEGGTTDFSKRVKKGDVY